MRGQIRSRLRPRTTRGQLPARDGPVRSGLPDGALPVTGLPGQPVGQPGRSGHPVQELPPVGKRARVHDPRNVDRRALAAPRPRHGTGSRASPRRSGRERMRGSATSTSCRRCPPSAAESFARAREGRSSRRSSSDRPPGAAMAEVNMSMNPGPKTWTAVSWMRWPISGGTPDPGRGSDCSDPTQDHAPPRPPAHDLVNSYPAARREDPGTLLIRTPSPAMGRGSPSVPPSVPPLVLPHPRLRHRRHGGRRHGKPETAHLRDRACRPGSPSVAWPRHVRRGRRPRGGSSQPSVGPGRRPRPPRPGNCHPAVGGAFPVAAGALCPMLLAGLRTTAAAVMLSIVVLTRPGRGSCRCD
jgi:hypothetical protein